MEARVAFTLASRRVLPADPTLVWEDKSSSQTPATIASISPCVTVPEVSWKVSTLPAVSIVPAVFLAIVWWRRIPARQIGPIGPVAA